jgi:hypothetical protein
MEDNCIDFLSKLLLSLLLKKWSNLREAKVISYSDCYSESWISMRYTEA